MLAIGITIHISLDYSSGQIFHSLSFLPNKMQDYIIPTLDGILLVIWIFYLEIKHKISDFI
jgi:hypothetical protein